MKTIKLLGMFMLSAVLCMCLSACSSDDDDFGDVSNIYGTWQISHTKGWSSDTDGSNKETWDEDDNDYRWVFDEDGSVHEYTYSVLTDSYRSNIIRDYTIEGNKLVIDHSGTTDVYLVTYIIKRINETTMVLVDNEESDYYEEMTFIKVE